MKFLILPYYPFYLPTEEATNGSPNRRRDSGGVRRMEEKGMRGVWWW
ncbi:hypothetical protein E1A91_A05G184900v1 [Gossypium mustelinum]|uniref:Uncharacterized protein n=1 Tax=Gossypium mustelinum TaxID=34275 RepID=A0A5D2Z6T4_GOSMU|nr:hypothetical protein E1A91_A05G184900v1 [Gossypium mustelinum]